MTAAATHCHVANMPVSLFVHTLLLPYLHCYHFLVYQDYVITAGTSNTRPNA
jgi:hypothetical protein